MKSLLVALAGIVVLGVGCATHHDHYRGRAEHHGRRGYHRPPPRAYVIQPGYQPAPGYQHHGR